MATASVKMRASVAGWFGLLGLVFTNCGGSTPAAGYDAASWPEADSLFHRDPRWLGADAAYTVPLGGERILWLFGDTFVATSDKHVRSESKMVRNTIAIQDGRDPTTAMMTFYWRGTAEAPQSFFPEDGDRWYWPGHGIMLGETLVLFFQRLRPTPGEGLGFAAEGWRAAVIANASGDPLQWDARMISPATAPAGIAAGAAVNRDADRVVSLAQREPGDHAGFLVRWLEPDLAAGSLDAAEWWTADRGWLDEMALGAGPSVVMADAGPESSIHFDTAHAKWVHVRSDGFGGTNIVVSEAARLEGPWSAPRFVFRPPESDRAGVLVYAAKAHPELDAGGAVAITYASNTLNDLATLVSDTSLYYPRFVRLSVR